jgi:hypothetical protein
LSPACFKTLFKVPRGISLMDDPLRLPCRVLLHACTGDGCPASVPSTSRSVQSA